MSLPEYGRVERISLDGCHLGVRNGKVTLLLIVEAYDGAEMLCEVAVEAPRKENDTEAADDDHEVSREGEVLGIDGGVIGRESSSSLATAGGSLRRALGGHGGLDFDSG